MHSTGYSGAFVWGWKGVVPLQYEGVWGGDGALSYLRLRLRLLRPCNVLAYESRMTRCVVKRDGRAWCAPQDLGKTVATRC